MVNCNNPLGGELTICLSNENDDDKTQKTDQSNQHLFLLQLIESSIQKFSNIDHKTTYLNAQFLYGVQILKHTGAFRGNYYSYLMALDKGYHLTIQLFPKFPTSVVEVAGSKYIPLAYDTKNGFMAITFEDNEPMKRAILDLSTYKTCNPVGEFDFVVMGANSDGRIQGAKIGYEEETQNVIQYTLLTQSQALKRMTQVKAKPRYLFKSLDRVGVWQEFIPWQYIHWTSHGAADTVRSLSVFFHPLRKKTKMSPFNFQKGSENWEDHRKKK
jgi:hypothetical protein